MNSKPSAPTAAVPHAGLLFALLEKGHDLMAISDTQGQLVWANERYRSATGTDATSGQLLQALVYPGTASEKTRKAIEQALQGTPLHDVELVLKRSTGLPLPLQVNALLEMGQVLWALKECPAAVASKFSAPLADARICVWRHELGSGRILFDAHAEAILPAAPGPEGLSEMELRSHIHTDDLPRVLLSAELALNSNRPVDTEARFRRADGSWRYVLTRRVVQRAADGAPLAHVGLSMDVSEQVEHSHRSTGQAHRLDAAAQAAGVGLWSITMGTGETDWNAQMYELFDMVGASRTPSLAEWVDQCVHVQDRQRVWRDLRAYLREGSGALELEFRALQRDGANRWMVLRAAVDTVSTDKRRLFGIVMDVTEQHKALLALRGADERAALAARLAGIGTWVLDHGPVVERWDEQMFRLRGLEPRDTPPTREERLALLHPDDAHVVLDSQQAALSTDDATNYEFRVQIPGGGYRWLASRSIPVRDERGRTVRRVGVNWDITENKTAEVTRQQKLLAERENKAKSQFLSRMSHELRTPLNAVLGFTHLLMQEQAANLAHEQATRLGHIHSAGEHLLALINDMLDLSSLEAGRLKLDLQAVSVSAVLAQAMALVEPLAAQHRVRLQLHEAQGETLADPTRLRQVLINLLSNAIKYNRPQGEVSVTARSGGEFVTLLVHDTGRGLNAEQLSHLFEPFNRLGIESEGIEGAGIGLVIVKGLTQAMGGSISVTSTPGEGTQFQIVLPAAKLPAAAGSAQAIQASPVPARQAIVAVGAQATARKGQVLYIEDNEVNVLLVEQLVLGLEGLEIACEPDGTQGVQRALQLRPDLILVDMQLPDFDGFEVLRRLREHSETAQTMCIALSANAMPQDISRAMSVGFQDYWTKPIDVKAFLGSLRELFPLQPDEQPHAGTPGT